MAVQQSKWRATAASRCTQPYISVKKQVCAIGIDRFFVCGPAVQTSTLSGPSNHTSGQEDAPYMDVPSIGIQL